MSRRLFKPIFVYFSGPNVRTRTLCRDSLEFCMSMDVRRYHEHGQKFWYEHEHGRRWTEQLWIRTNMDRKVMEKGKRTMFISWVIWSRFGSVVLKIVENKFWWWASNDWCCFRALTSENNLIRNVFTKTFLKKTNYEKQKLFPRKNKTNI